MLPAFAHLINQLAHQPRWLKVQRLLRIPQLIGVHRPYWKASDLPVSFPVRKEFSEEINKIYWKDVLWNESYFIASGGGVTVSILRKYIERQQSSR